MCYRNPATKNHAVDSSSVKRSVTKNPWLSQLGSGCISPRQRHKPRHHILPERTISVDSTVPFSYFFTRLYSRELQRPSESPQTLSQ